MTRTWILIVAASLALGCYASEADEDESSACVLDDCVADCVASGRVGGACISAPPDGPSECVCR